jgi:hypothetical protein
VRRFVLVRDTDVTGISGQGVVVWGIEFPDGRVSYRWNTTTATSCDADSMADVVRVHGHNGATRVEWVDTEAEADRWRLLAAQEGQTLFARGGIIPPGTWPPGLESKG